MLVFQELQMGGIISKSLAWIAHPYNDTDSDPVDWFAYAALAIIAAYLWSKVVRQLIES
jgi:hypothetical protein